MRIRIRLDEVDPPVGALCDDEDPDVERQFAGWLGLMSAIQAVISGCEHRAT